MSPKSNRHDAAPLPDATSASGDLTWLAYRAAAALGDAFNEVSRDAGLADLRDWLVLALISKGPERTQLEIATELGVDKTTLVSILDRLERGGLVVRTLSARDRRVRIPEATAKGIEVMEQVAIARDTAISRRLAAIPTRDHAKFHAMLWSIVQNR
ncbi:MarR family winged helix-turn-helix transcriptional regulator [Kutzneria sp. CA-103260]|uniref:MarR family winged helix-turn-helix transcriptional regulator n=1 Tax=Kutzneria sp. CA-103260 TaxID=2802641 RepID=UPI001BA5B7E3|nr:MarR family transcriptional regulator [Kutzneria sp. CA-103260]QUQ68849.1 Transcriptional regulator SlyA [Kutzneria sp. CA-103260]